MMDRRTKKALKKLTAFMVSHNASFTVTTNEDGDDYHLEFTIFNEYYEVRTYDEARELLKYCKELMSARHIKRHVRELRRALKKLNLKEVEQ